jgi:hypothetical protein
MNSLNYVFNISLSGTDVTQIQLDKYKCTLKKGHVNCTKEFGYENLLNTFYSKFCW